MVGAKAAAIWQRLWHQRQCTRFAPAPALLLTGAVFLVYMYSASTLRKTPLTPQLYVSSRTRTATSPRLSRKFIMHSRSSHRNSARSEGGSISTRATTSPSRMSIEHSISSVLKPDLSGARSTRTVIATTGKPSMPSRPTLRKSANSA
eukprot:scpid105081/ scgid26676/ 